MEETLSEPTKTSPKDIFFHLLAMVTLYASAAGFLTLLFQYVNVFIPDPLESSYYSLSAAYQSIRFAVASLIVVFPVYLWVSWFLNKLYEKVPSKRDLRIRKWLIYFTLFAAALIIMGDLVTLIYNFLNGELTLRFFLKVFAVFAVTGSIFWYYFWDIKKHNTE